MVGSHLIRVNQNDAMWTQIQREKCINCNVITSNIAINFEYNNEFSKKIVGKCEKNKLKKKN